MKTTKRTMSLVLMLLLLAVFNTIASAFYASDITVTSPTEGYYIPGISMNFAAVFDGTANSNATLKALYPYYKYNNNNRSSFGYLTKNGTSFTGTATPSTSCYVPGRKINLTSPWMTRYFCFEATKDGEILLKQVHGYITALKKTGNNSYQANDTTFYYTSPTNNPFKGVGTPQVPRAYFDNTNGPYTYNCLAYVVSINYFWSWPWTDNNGNGRNPTATELDNYMSKSGVYSSRPGDTLTHCASKTWCDVIYYSKSSTMGSGNDGHFAKVVAWDSSGNPTKIMSKWGQCELIKSNSYNPFSNTGDYYGSPRRYYKYD